MMIKRSAILQELANEYPPGTSIREREQSLGQRLLNAFGNRLEDLEKDQIRTGKNLHLAIANLDEIDITYKSELPSTVEFNQDDDNPLEIKYLEPVIHGVSGSEEFELEIASENDLRTFWYQHLPDRISVSETLSGEHLLLESTYQGVTFSGLNTPFHPSKVNISLLGGETYLKIDPENKRVSRSLIEINGVTKKGTEESEAIVFPWDQKQSSFKEWKSISSISCPNLEDGIQIKVTVDDFNHGATIDFWNLEESNNRQKIDFMWDLGSTSYGSTLDAVMYSTDNINLMLTGAFDTYIEQGFELLTVSGENIEAIDFAQQPFSDSMWVVSSDKLFLFDSYRYMTEDSSPIKDNTLNSIVYLDFSSDHTVRGEPIDIEFIVRTTVNPIVSARLTVTAPDLTQSGILEGGLISDYETWYSVDPVDAKIDLPLEFTPNTLGDYTFVIEGMASDGQIFIDKRILSVDSKTALKEFSLPETISGVNGLSFDSEQKLWVSDANGYHKISFHHDVAMIDYEGKTIYTRENYDEVKVWI